MEYFALEENPKEIQRICVALVFSFFSSISSLSFRYFSLTKNKQKQNLRPDLVEEYL